MYLLQLNCEDFRIKKTISSQKEIAGKHKNAFTLPYFLLIPKRINMIK